MLVCPSLKIVLLFLVCSSLKTVRVLVCWSLKIVRFLSELFLFEGRKSREQLAVTNRYVSEPNTPTSSVPGCKPGVKTARKSCPQIQMFRCSESLKVSICPSSRPLRFMPSPFCARTFRSFLPLLCSYSTPTDYPARRTLSDALSIVVCHLSPPADRKYSLSSQHL